MRRFLSQDNRLLLHFLGRRFRASSLLTLVAAMLGGVVDYWFALAIQLFLASMGLVAALAHPAIFNGIDQPLVVGGLLVGLGTLRAAFVFTQGFASGIAQEAASSRVRTSAIMRILPLDESARVSASEALFTYTELGGRSGIYLVNFIKFISGSLQTLILGLAMLYLSWMDCLLGAGLLCAASLFLLRLNVHLGQVAKLNPIIWNDSMAAIESASRNWFYIRIKHMHERERERLCAQNADVQAIGFRLRWLTEISPAAVNLIAVVILAVLTVLRASLTHTAPTVFLAFLYVFLRFAQALGDSARSASALVEHRPYFERLLAWVRTLNETDTAAGEAVDRSVSLLGRARTPPPSTLPGLPAHLPRAPLPHSPRIVLRELSFRYEANAPLILDRLDVDVAAGSQLAIVGPSGCGKSTLLALILGFRQPVGGGVEIDGIAPQRYCADHAEHIGYVGAEPYIVTGSIRDNILFGSQAAYDDTQIYRALAQAALADVVRALPAGLDTPIRHHDVALSMGQRQRLALARALLPAPALLILDEASANLDDVTEDAIATTIDALKGTTTTIIVSHKLGLVKYADRVIDLGAGMPRARDSRSAP